MTVMLMLMLMLTAHADFHADANSDAGDNYWYADADNGKNAAADFIRIFPSTDEKGSMATLSSCPFLDKNGMWRRLIFDILISLGKSFRQNIFENI